LYTHFTNVLFIPAPSRDEVKNALSYTTLPPQALICAAWLSIATTLSPNFIYIYIVGSNVTYYTYKSTTATPRVQITPPKD